MVTTKEDIRTWFIQAKDEGYTHMLVVCDTFDWIDYDVGFKAKTPKEAKEFTDSYNGKDMQKVMECYNLKKDMDAQLNQRRCLEY